LVERGCRVCVLGKYLIYIKNVWLGVVDGMVEKGQ
jgi:hypothetical protein